MNFSDYENKLPFPNKADFTTTYYYEHGQCVFQVGPGEEVPENLHGFVREVALDKDAYFAKVEAHRAEGRRLKEKFKVDLFDDLDITDNPKAELLFNLALKYGDEEISRIYDYAFELVELIK